MQTVILCGGEGTRLRPLTENTPKPLVKILGEPALVRLLRDLKSHGIDSATLCTRYLSGMIESALGDVCEGVKLTYSREEHPLGTAGCVRNAFRGEDVLVLSGDGVTGFDYGAIINFHKFHSADITIVSREVDDPREYGLLTVSDGRVTGFIEKPGFDSCVTDLANTGCYVISADIIKRIRQGEQTDFAKDIFPAALKEGRRIFTYTDHTFWHDIGDIPSLLECQRDLLERSGRDNMIMDGSKIPSDCVVSFSVMEPGSAIGSGSRLISSCIGKNSVIASCADISEAVISDNCTVGSGLIMMKNSVLGSGCVVGSDVRICEGVRVAPGTKIRDGAVVRTDINAREYQGLSFSERGAAEGLTDPLDAVKLASSAVYALGARRMVLGGSGGLFDALSLGIRCAGADVYDLRGSSFGETVYAARRLGCEYAIFAGECPMIFSASTVDLKRTDERGIERRFERFLYEKRRPGRMISAAAESEMYIGHLRSILPKQGSISAKFKSLPRRESEIFSDIFGHSEPESLTFTLAQDGSTVYASDGGNIIPQESLTVIAAGAMAKYFGEVTVFSDAPLLCESAAEEHGGKFSRSPSADDPVSEFCYDPLMLAALIIKYLSDENITLSDAQSRLKKVIYTRRVIDAPEGLPKILAEGFKEAQAGRELTLEKPGAKAFIRPSRSGSAVRVYIESVSQEAADELSADILKRLCLDKGKDL